MAAPTFVHDLTTLSDAESTTNWVAVGGAMLSLDPDNKIQSGNSIGVPATANTVVGAVFNRTAGAIDLFGKHLFIWLLAAQPGAVASFAAGGVRIRVCGPTATNFGEWYVGGNDVAWVTEGKWRLVVIDCNRPFDVTGGTAPVISGAAGATIQHVGATYLARISLMFGFGLNIDIMRWGTKIAVEGGSDADPITLQSIYDADFVTDPVNNVFGIVTKNRAGVFEINGELRIGDESGAVNTVFSSQSEVIVFQDQPCALDYLKILAQEDTGTTDIKFGVGTGTGDDRVGLSGSVIDRINGIHGREYSIDLNQSGLTLVEMYGTTIQRAKRGIQLPAASGHEMISSTLAQCGQSDIGQCLTRKCIFTGHGRIDTGAADLDVTANPVDSGTITINATTGTNVYTRTAGGSGSFITDGFEVGMVVLLSGFTNAVNNGRKRISAVAATTLTMEASQVLVTETGGGDERIRVEFAFTRASGSFVTDGFAAGMAIDVTGFSTAANNMSRVVTNVKATQLFVRHDLTMAAESGSGDERIYQAGIDGIGALLWNEDIDITDSSFLGNTQENGESAAIEHPSAAGTPYTYDNLLFAGNDFDVNNTSGSSITVNKSGTANPSTSEGDSVTFVGSVTVEVTVVDKDNVAIQSAQVAVYKTSDNSEIMNTDTNAGGVASTSYSGSTPAAVYWRVRKSSTGGTKYRNTSGVGTIVASTGMSITVTLYVDPINSA